MTSRKRGRVFRQRGAHGGVQYGGSELAGDWYLAQGAFTAAGVYTGGKTWGQLISVATGTTPNGIHLVQIPVSPNTGGTVAPPRVSEVVVHAVVGDINIDAVALVQSTDVCMGIYVAQQATGGAVGSAWTVLDPSANSDVQRQDWLWLKCFKLDVPSGGTVAPFYLNIPLALKLNVRLGAGQALAFVVASNTLGSGTLGVDPYLRSHLKFE